MLFWLPTCCPRNQALVATPTNVQTYSSTYRFKALASARSGESEKTQNTRKIYLKASSKNEKGTLALGSRGRLGLVMLLERRGGKETNEGLTLSDECIRACDWVTPFTSGGIMCIAQAHSMTCHSKSFHPCSIVCEMSKNEALLQGCNLLHWVIYSCRIQGAFQGDLILINQVIASGQNDK